MIRWNKRSLITFLQLLLVICGATTKNLSALAFLLPIQNNDRTRLSRVVDKSKTQQEMCICIDCARVTNCKAYHFVETKHQQPHMTEDPVGNIQL